MELNIRNNQSRKIINSESIYKAALKNYNLHGPTQRTTLPHPGPPLLRQVLATHREDQEVHLQEQEHRPRQVPGPELRRKDQWKTNHRRRRRPRKKQCRKNRRNSDPRPDQLQVPGMRFFDPKTGRTEEIRRH